MKSIKDKIIVDNIVDAVTPISFMKKEKCSFGIYEKVKARVKRKAEEGVENGKSQFDVILELRSYLQAFLQSEKLLADESSETPESSKKKPSTRKNGKEVGPDDDFVHKLKKTANKNSDKSERKYFNYLSEYKLDNDVHNRVKAIEMRGKSFRTSNDGSCPKCRYRSNVFVILDFLFPSNDLPEILQYLKTQGKAVLWSSKEHVDCKDPPTFLCGGRCPSDISKSGFNINWTTTDLEKIYLFPETNFVEVINKTKADAMKIDTEMTVMNVDEEKVPDLFVEDFVDTYENKNENENVVFSDDDEYDEGHVDIGYYRNKVSWVVLDEVIDDSDQLIETEEKIIRTMLALEEARTDFIYGEMKVQRVDHSNILQNEVIEVKDDDEEEGNGNKVAKDPTKEDSLLSVDDSDDQSPAHLLKEATYYGDNDQPSKPSFTAADFPVSKDGACPYCHSSNVVYIIIDDGAPEGGLPDLLKRLKLQGCAKKLPKGKYDLPSFQCNGCSYGFNLDWTQTNLQKIFAEKISNTSSTSHVMASSAMSANKTVSNNVTSDMQNYYYSHPYMQGGFAAVPPWGFPVMGMPPLNVLSYNSQYPYNMYNPMYNQRMYDPSPYSWTAPPAPPAPPAVVVPEKIKKEPISSTSIEEVIMVDDDVPEVSTTNVEKEQSSTDIVQQSSTDIVQQSSADVVQQSSSDAIQQSSTDAVQQSSTDAVQQSSTDAVQQSSTDAIQQSSTVAIQQSSTDAIQQSSTDAIQQSSTDAIQQSSTDAIQQSLTDAVQQSSTDAIQQSSTDAIQQSSTNAVQQSSTDAIQQSPMDKKELPSTVIDKQSSTDAVLQSSIDNEKQSSLGIDKQSSTDTMQLSSTDIDRQSSTYPVQKSSTDKKEQSSTENDQQSSTYAVQQPFEVHLSVEAPAQSNKNIQHKIFIPEHLSTTTTIAEVIIINDGGVPEVSTTNVEKEQSSSDTDGHYKHTDQKSQVFPHQQTTTKQQLGIDIDQLISTETTGQTSCGVDHLSTNFIQEHQQRLITELHPDTSIKDETVPLSVSNNSSMFTGIPHQVVRDTLNHDAITCAVTVPEVAAKALSTKHDENSIDMPQNTCHQTFNSEPISENSTPFVKALTIESDRDPCIDIFKSACHDELTDFDESKEIAHLQTDELNSDKKLKRNSDVALSDVIDKRPKLQKIDHGSISPTLMLPISTSRLDMTAIVDDSELMLDTTFKDSKLQGEWLNAESTDPNSPFTDSPFTDSLVNIVGDAVSSYSEKQKQTETALNCSVQISSRLLVSEDNATPSTSEKIVVEEDNKASKQVKQKQGTRGRPKNKRGRGGRGRGKKKK